MSQRQLSTTRRRQPRGAASERSPSHPVAGVLQEPTGPLRPFFTTETCNVRLTSIRDVALRE
jgi:hypothetical protein